MIHQWFIKWVLEEAMSFLHNNWPLCHPYLVNKENQQPSHPFSGMLLPKQGWNTYWYVCEKLKVMTPALTEHWQMSFFSALKTVSTDSVQFYITHFLIFHMAKNLEWKQDLNSSSSLLELIIFCLWYHKLLLWKWLWFHRRLG